MNRANKPVPVAMVEVARESDAEDTVAARIRRQFLDEVTLEKLLSSDVTTYARRGTY
ncbi:MAG: hypothetical protein ACYC19_00265 [Acidimicrobiales bacterium]